ncbi:MAG: four helix bundle protein [Persicimonas sp.]
MTPLNRPERIYEQMQSQKLKQKLEDPMLGHERLDVYQCSLEFFTIAASAQEDAPRGYGPLADQLRRASTSILLNIAEGCGKVSVDEKARYFAIARGSALESAATLDAFKALGAVEESGYARGKALLGRIVAMLTRMCEQNGRHSFG